MNKDYFNEQLNLAYAAGLFDGEGCVNYKKYKEKKKNGTYDCWRISLEMAMTDESTINIFHQIVGVGTVRKKPRDKTGHKMQYRWRCTFRDAYKVAVSLFPFAHTKAEKLSEVIHHYTEQKPTPENVVNLQYYKMWIAKKEINAKFEDD